MKTLAAFKRTIEAGQIWHTYYHPAQKDMGERVVKRKTSSAVIFKTKEGKDSWLHFPKAGDFRSLNESTIEILEGGKPILTYRRVA